MKALKSPGPNFKLYGVYHHHEYGGGVHLVWADHDPSEQEVVAACCLDYEPEKDEWIAVSPIDATTTIATGMPKR